MRHVLALVAFGLIVSSGAAQTPKLVSLSVQPERVDLTEPLDGRQLLVTGTYADGSLRDLTPQAIVRANDLVDVSDGFVSARREGQGMLIVEAEGMTANVKVSVGSTKTMRPASFRQDVQAALSVGGCNSGACHGSPNGRGGLRLSVRGYDPDADYRQLARDLFARRINTADPSMSLMLQKPLGRIPHEGGVRFSAASMPARVIEAWIGQGARADIHGPAVKRLEILPGARVLRAPTRQQQLAVLAHFADGSSRDVTRLTVFSTNDASATTSLTGLVEFSEPGEVIVIGRYLDTLAKVQLTHLDANPGFVWKAPAEVNYIDRHVFAKLKTLEILPSDTCSDTAFMRRIYLDLCGIVPTLKEAKEFLADPAPDKRAKLIDRLLDRSDYADFWTLKWMDILRNSRKALGTEGATAYHAWMRGHIQKNTPLDQVARELLTAKGSTFTSAPANYFRVDRSVEDLTDATAQIFCGVRLQCAQCHNHPWESWTQQDYYGLAAFFARVDRGDTGKKAAKKGPGGPIIVSLKATGEVRNPHSGEIVAPRFLRGAAPTIAAERDRREALADWLVSKGNPYFARAHVNRVWFHLLGKGIVDPVDDFRDTNPPSNELLLDALAQDFSAHNHDVKHLIRTIMNSRTYQLSARSNASNKKDTKYHSHTIQRLLTAEQLLDSLGQATEHPESFSKAKAVKGVRAIHLVDGESNHPFLKAFGQPARQTPCEFERTSEVSLARALQMVNGPTVNAMVTSPKNRIGRLIKRPDAEILQELYWATVARAPSAEETKEALAHVTRAGDRRKGWEDIQWALINTREFLFRY